MAGISTNIIQAAWIVDDLEKSVQNWLNTARVGPFFIVSHAKVDSVMYRGAPATLDMSAALAQAGPIQIELIQQHNNGPSAYRDSFPMGTEGFHHLCSITTTYDADLERYSTEGCVPATQGAFGDMRFAYVDTRARLGYMMEILEDRPLIRQMFKTVSDASAGWDGRDPVRYF